MKSSSFAFLIVVLFVAGIGSYVGGRASKAPLPPIELQAMQASTVVKANNISMATGFIDKETSGLYFLNHDNGDLQCLSINQRTGKINGTFQANVAADMNFDKAGIANYLFLTSYIVSPINKSPVNKHGESICFVADTISGKIIGYKVAYNKVDMISGRMQKGVMKAVFTSLYRSN